MNNFYNFILEDTKAKKELISSLPKKTKTNIKDLNDNIKIMSSKYADYKLAVRNYLLAKSNSFLVKKDNKKEQELIKVNNNIVELSKTKYLLNTHNTYFEKMGFDSLFYEMSVHHDFDSLTNLINNFFDKFDLVGIKLTSDDFKYTSYVYDYMIEFLKVRQSTDKNYHKASEVFESIYWQNPDIMEHLSLNLVLLTNKYKNKFIEYLKECTKISSDANKVKNNLEVNEKLLNNFNDLNCLNDDDLYLIIKKAIKGNINIDNYFKDNKYRINTYESLLNKKVDEVDYIALLKYEKILRKLQTNLEEYQAYLKFIPLIEYFKKNYLKKLGKENIKSINISLNELSKKIKKDENKLKNINKKIFNKNGLFVIKDESIIKKLKIESLGVAKDLDQLYSEYNSTYFESKIITYINENSSIYDVLSLFSSYDYFKKQFIQNIYKFESFDEVKQLSDEIDLFVLNPTNVITSGMIISVDASITEIMVNKYLLDNIFITEDDLTDDNINNLFQRVSLLLNLVILEEKPDTLEKIKFMCEVNKIIEKEK